MDKIVFLIPHGMHVFFFALEAVFFDRPSVHRGMFRVKDPLFKDAIKPWATNQGFYNLFLALGGFYGVYLLSQGNVAAAKPLLQVIYASYVAAGGVLLATTGKALGAFLQAVPALVALYFL